MTKKNKIYVAVIIGCMVITVGIIMWGSSGSSGTPTADTGASVVNIPVNNGNTTGSSSTAGNSAPVLGNTDYPPPAVFPADTNFDTSVLNSGDFTRLKDYEPVTITPEELGAGGVF